MSKLEERGFRTEWAESYGKELVKDVRKKRRQKRSSELEAAVHKNLSVRYCPHCRKAIDASLW